MINIDLGLHPMEIDAIIKNLKEMRADPNPDQHFHLSSNFDGKCRVGEFTLYIKSPDESDDIQVMSRQYAPGETISLSSDTIADKIKYLFAKLFGT